MRWARFPEYVSRSFSVHTILFLTFSSPQDCPARQILAFEIPYFTVFGTEASIVVNCVHECSMTISDFWFYTGILSEIMTFEGRGVTRMLSNQASVPNPLPPSLQINEDALFYPSFVDENFPKMTLCTYSLLTGMLPVTSGVVCPRCQPPSTAASRSMSSSTSSAISLSISFIMLRFPSPSLTQHPAIGSRKPKLS